MSAFWRAFFASLAIVFSLAASFTAGYLVRDRLVPENEFPILEQAYHLLKENGLKDLPPPPSLEYGMIRGMLQAYNDPYTIFVEPPQHELEGNALQGSFGGIGVQLSNDADGNWLLYPYPDSPAREAGVQEGDRLLAVDRLTITPQTSAEVIQSAIRGPIGERVTLSVGRPPDYQPIKITIKRAEIPLPSVTWHLDLEEPRVGVLEINLIAASTSDEIQRAVRDMQSRGAAYFIMDLRHNPGGLLTAGVDIARLFLKEGTIIQQQYRGKTVETYSVERAGPLAEIPLAVLISHDSASAAEIVAGALKFHRRALIVGSPSFGKDTIQLIFDLRDKSSLHVTAGHWWIPGLEPAIGGTGVSPDILVDNPDPNSKRDPVIRAAIQALVSH